MNDDLRYFTQLPKRQTRLRTPAPGEFVTSWRLLGDHQPDRRRVLIWRVPADNPGRRLIEDGLMRIPILLRSDETVENDDATLLPILDAQMRAAAVGHPTQGFVMTQEVGAFPGWVD